ncbi:Transposable element P transposase [Amphibalanus amphitrite]|uniref:Transposable element P transposase n=1 Tax=Amphibalanus amphitrite TaxID=1232801 RepID=A0A6A4X3L5_AMPAM|nr:Transposable element P transposase [Amphibalanus amphitrite]
MLKAEVQARQRVRPAVQLLSATSALALERYLGRDEAARFFRVVDDGFDVLNAGHPPDVKPFRRGYSGTPEQETALTALQREVEGLRVGSARHLPFQGGLLVDVRSVPGLLKDLQKTLGPDTYILTRRLSQDRLEATFGLLRVGGGSNTNPTPTDAMSRLRLLSLLMLTRRGVNILAPGDLPTAAEEQDADDPGGELDDIFTDYVTQAAPTPDTVQTAPGASETAPGIAQTAPGASETAQRLTGF